MAHYVANSVTRTTLQAIKTVSGRNYERIVQQAGLARYLDRLPPADDNPGCTAEEYSGIPAAVYAMLDEALTRLFLRNTGTAAAERIMRDPRVQALYPAGSAVPAEQKLDWFVHVWAPLVERTWSRTVLSEDATA